MSRSLIQIIGGFAVVIILFLGGFFGVMPLLNAARDKDAEISNAQLARQLMRSDIEDLQNEQENIAELREQIAVFESSIPENHEQEAFIRYLDALAVTHEVEINEYSLAIPARVVNEDAEAVGNDAEQAERGGGLFSSQILLDVRADYHVLVAFLSDLQDSDRLLRIHAITVSEPEDRRFQIDASVYQLIAPTRVEASEEDAEAPAEQPAP